MVSRQRLGYGGLVLLTMLTLGTLNGCGTTSTQRTYNPNYNQPKTYQLQEQERDNYSSKKSFIDVLAPFGCLFYLLAN